MTEVESKFVDRGYAGIDQILRLEPNFLGLCLLEWE